MIKAAEFDARFDRGENMTEFLDFSRAKRPGHALKRVPVDLPTWMIEALDREAKRLSVTRQSLIKVWLAERLERLSSSESGL
jgi:hypothetical protein